MPLLNRYNSIHRQQLFHWVGHHIEEEANRKLTDDLREKYVSCLEDAFENGLWSKTPVDPDQIGNGKLIKVSRPITCFTEWSLGQSLPHSQRYGRLALGFPKRWVLNRGGQPVTYVMDGSKNNPYVAAMEGLAMLFRDPKVEATRSDIDELRNRFDYLCHFAKRIKKPSTPKPIIIAKAKAKTAAKPTTVKKTSATAAARLLEFSFLRKYGPTLHYLEEREWRIVYDEVLKKHFKKGPKSGTGIPKFYIPFKPGSELYTLVLPDNRTVNIALAKKNLKEWIYPKKSPHVTVLSLEDIGTF